MYRDMGLFHLQPTQVQQSNISTFSIHGGIYLVFTPLRRWDKLCTIFGISFVKAFSEACILLWYCVCVCVCVNCVMVWVSLVSLSHWQQTSIDALAVRHHHFYFSTLVTDSMHFGMFFFFFFFFVHSITVGAALPSPAAAVELKTVRQNKWASLYRIIIWFSTCTCTCIVQNVHGTGEYGCSYT